MELKLDWNKHWDPGCITGIRNHKIYSILIAASEETMANEMNVESCTELDSHTSMPVVGKHAYIIAKTGKKVDVSPFTPDYQPLTVPLVDVTVREMGVTVNDVPKIHKEDPTVDDHMITFMETGFRIPLSLWGIFSYFPTSKPTHDDLLNPTEVYILSPATWNHTPMHIQQMRSPCWTGKETCNKRRTVSIGSF